jgi:GrpB-like predicted nucleotidyltransferase (UPF0157 family)
MPRAGPSTAIQVVDYDPSWPRIFDQLRKGIWPSVCDVATAIEHVGSTSVPGIAAKPIIDIDLVIESIADLPLVIGRLAALGYKYLGNLGIEGREAFRSIETQPHHHLYVCVQNSFALRNHLAVRDYLRNHPSDAAAYSKLKKRLAEQFSNERERYMEGKTEFILLILKQCGSLSA